MIRDNDSEIDESSESDNGFCLYFDPEDDIPVEEVNHEQQN